MHLAFAGSRPSLISFMARPRPSVPSAPISLLLPSARLSVPQLLSSRSFPPSRLRIHLSLVCLPLLGSLSLFFLFVSFSLFFVSWNVAYMVANTGPGFHLYSRTSSANLKAKGEQKPDPSFCMCAQAWLLDTQASMSGRERFQPLLIRGWRKNPFNPFSKSRTSTTARQWWILKIFFYCVYVAVVSLLRLFRYTRKIR